MMADENKCVTRHQAFIFDRGGSARIDELIDLSFVRYERDRDTMTEGRVRIEGALCQENADLINRISTHRHELVIYRGTERVWEGPLHRIASHGEYTEITAKDVSNYIFHTPLTQKWDSSFPTVETVTERIARIIRFELTHSRQQIPIGGSDPVTVPAWESLDPPIDVLVHMVIHHFPNEAGTSAITLPYEMTVGEHLANLAQQSGIDWTVVGRALHIWDVSRSIGTLPQLTEADFRSEVVVTEYGSDHAQSAYVVGQEGVYGDALQTQDLDYFGPWTKVFTAYNEAGDKSADPEDQPTQAELNSQAARNLSGRVPPPIEVRVPDNSSVLLSDDLTMNMLIPGSQVPIRATFNARQLAQLQKIDKVVVTETPEGEDVQVTFTPATKADSDIVEE